jgi:hypothetical protein
MFIQIDPGPNPDFDKQLPACTLLKFSPVHQVLAVQSWLQCWLLASMSPSQSKKCTCLHNTHLSSLALTSLP